MHTHSPRMINTVVNLSLPSTLVRRSHAFSHLHASFLFPLYICRPFDDLMDINNRQRVVAADEAVTATVALRAHAQQSLRTRMGLYTLRLRTSCPVGKLKVDAITVTSSFRVRQCASACTQAMMNAHTIVTCSLV